MVNKISDLKVRNYCLFTYAVVTSFPTNLLMHTYTHTYIYTPMNVIMLKNDNSVFKNCTDLFFYCIIRFKICTFPKVWTSSG